MIAVSIKACCVAFASLVIALGLLFGSVPGDAHAGSLVVTVTDNPDPAASQSNVTYLIKVKNAATVKATGAVATIPLPAGTQFVSCSTLPWVKPCTSAGGVVTVDIGNLVAAGILKIYLVLQMPVGPTSVVLSASATSSNVSGGSGQQTTTVSASDPGGGTRGALVVTVSDTPDPAPTLGQVTYAINVLNDGTTGASNVVVKALLPAGVQFVKCATTPSKTCALSSGTVSVTFSTIAAHATVKMSLVLAMPWVTVASTINLTASANGDGVSDDSQSETTTILPATAPVVYVSPGGQRSGTVSCGDTLRAANFQSDETTMQLQGGLGCASQPIALTMQASDKTLDLAGFKIVGAALPSNLGNIGIRILNATNVIIDGGDTSGDSGVEYFDFGVKDDGGSDGLTINSLRVFRARSAGIATISNGVALNNLVVDKTVAGSNSTAVLPGGVGIHASGNTLINECSVRRNAKIGIWLDGTYAVSGYVGTITGSVSGMQILQSAAVGIQLDNGPHHVKDTEVNGDGIAGTSTDGVVVGPTGTGSHLEAVVVKNHGSDGFVINGVGTLVDSSTADTTVGGNGFVVTGANNTLDNNNAFAVGNGYVITGSNNTLTSNLATVSHDGYVVSGDTATLTNNDAVGNGARGIVVSGAQGVFNTNLAQSNGTHGVVITGNNNQFLNNQSKQNHNVGFNVLGTGNSFQSNSAESNGGNEWVIGSGNIDGGSNRYSGKGFTFTSSGGTFN
jgi:uncharacterized repeat protein (TIGR01451 family)